jgi:hypothetical protein
LRKRIERATISHDGFFGFKCDYFALRTNEGNGVLHILLNGGFIPQSWLSRSWFEIHGADIVDIRALYGGSRRIANYLISGYLSRQSFERMSCSWGWVYHGFVGVWRSCFASWYQRDKVACLKAWNYHIIHWSPLAPPQAFLFA